ncbi:MAG: hypothetical protein WB421_14095, partial [Terriglobales bacterium]
VAQRQSTPAGCRVSDAPTAGFQRFAASAIATSVGFDGARTAAARGEKRPAAGAAAEQRIRVIVPAASRPSAQAGLGRMMQEMGAAGAHFASRLSVVPGARDAELITSKR